MVSSASWCHEEAGAVCHFAIYSGPLSHVECGAHHNVSVDRGSLAGALAGMGNLVHTFGPDNGHGKRTLCIVCFAQASNGHACEIYVMLLHHIIHQLLCGPVPG